MVGAVGQKPSKRVRYGVTAAGTLVVAAGVAGVLSGSSESAAPDPVLDPVGYVSACLDATSSYWRGRASVGTRWSPSDIRLVGDGAPTVDGRRTVLSIGLRAPDGTMLVRGRYAVDAVFADGLSDAELDRLGECERSLRPLDTAARRLASFPQRRRGRALEQIDAEPIRLERSGRAIGVSVPGPSMRSPSALMRAGLNWRSPDSTGLYLAEWIALRQEGPVRIGLCASTSYRMAGRTIDRHRFTARLRAGQVRLVQIRWSVRQPSSANRTLGSCPRRIVAR